jgi:hypothetical protein
MQQPPAETNVTVLPDTVQTSVLSEVKTTGSPEDAVAFTVNGGLPQVWVAGWGKLIV